ncbi:MAG: glycoside hydrolase family 2 protein, partial [Bacteroidetes bacterium]|nr:glycoside hydrolase family 2 protein [Bacteroidota bacterium]
MRRRTAVFYFTILLMISNMALSQDLEIIPLNDNWKFREYNMDAFKEATVPGNVFLDLMKLGLIPDPFFGDNEKLVQDVGMKEWEYIKTFKVDSSILKHKRIDMSFKGLDTYARVYINDSLAVRGANQFLEWFVDCRARLKYGDNTIRIHFLSPDKESERRYNKLRYKLPEGPRVMTRKAAYHFGWDWSPRLLTTGIHKPVELRLWDTLYILGIQYKLTHLNDSIAKFRAEIVINSMAPAQAEFAIEAEGKEVIRRGAELRQGASIVIVDFQIKNPKLWWSNGLGEAYLYNFISRVFINTEQKAIHTCRYGIKKLEIVTNKDSIGESFYFKLNGIPVFMKGANYVPPDNFMTRVGEETYRRIITDAKKANMNMLRVWGGGNYENDLFYDLCDENGILVWQDFMFANGIYPADKESLNIIRSEIIQQIVRLRNHPCMALWCGNNEFDQGWFNWGWQKQYGINKEDSLEMWKGHQKIFSETLPQSVIRYDSARIYIPTSPRHGWGRPESLTSGDSHYWGIWWGQEPISNYRKKIGRFMSEYGMQAFPNIKTIEAFSGPADSTFSSPALQQHQKHPKGFEYIKEYMGRDYLLPVKFGDYVYVSQLMQAEAMKTAIEAHRRAMPNCMGSLYWQFNDCWPAISWSSVDYYGRWKASHYFIKKAFNNIILSPDTING